MPKLRRTSDSAPVFKELADQLEVRCKAADLTFEHRRDEEDGDEFVSIQIPNGRETRRVLFSTADHISEFLASSFEKYVFLGDYVAIASYADSYIEAVLQFRGPVSDSVIGRTFGMDSSDDGSDSHTISIVAPDFAPRCKITVTRSSDDMHALEVSSMFLGQSRRWSLQISGIQISTHDQALAVLERLSNSLFFQIDVSRNIALSLRRDRRRQQPFGHLRKRVSDYPEIRFPRVGYDEAPITLYWYARSARQMPLLQFLAYYQCVEFYYPIYSQSEARRRVRNVLKDPTFRVNRDSDLGKVLSALGTGSRGVGDERSMLRATIRECIGEAQMREYLERSKESEVFFSTKTKGLTDCKIPIRNRDTDLRDPVADRIYDLRCKIVHTKTGGGDESVELLLPFSKEEDLLGHDIALLRFVAQQVLIAGSSDLEL